MTKQLLWFTLPMLLGNIMQQLYNVADAMIVGRFVSGVALGAVGSAGNVVFFFTSVFFGLTSGASIVISQFFGAKKIEELKRAVSTCVITLCGLALVIGATGFFISPAILRALATPDEAFADALIYLRVILVTGVFPMLYNMYTAFLRALGDSKSPLYILLLTVLLNVVLDILLVVYIPMGVMGAALATAISQCIACVLTMLVAFKKSELLRIKRLVFDGKLLKLITGYSIPAAVQVSLSSLMSLSVSRLVNGFGAVAMAGNAAFVKLDMFIVMPLNNIALALPSFVGQNLGAGQEVRAKQGMRVSFTLCLVTSSVLGLCALLFAQPLVGMFVEASDPNAMEIIRVGAELLRIAAPFYLVVGIATPYMGFFRGAGDQVIVMAVVLLRALVRAVIAYALVYLFGMGIEAIAYSLPFGYFISLLISYVYYKQRRWAGKVATEKG